MRKCYDLAMRHPILLGLVVLHLFLGPRAQENKPPDLNALLLDLDRLELGVRREAAIGLSHQKQLPASFAWFEEVRTFRHSGEVFLHLRKRYDGTGHFSEDLIRSFSPPDSLVEVEVQRPWVSKWNPGRISPEATSCSQTTRRPSIFTCGSKGMRTAARPAVELSAV
jgi:hypothetical protein